jgi:hypothetical protein
MQAQLDDFIPVDSVAARDRTRSLETLARLDAAQCEAMFADAEGFPFDSLVGHPRGRVLAIPGRDRGAVGALMRALHASPAWIWEGKSFAARPGAVEGVGINRVRWFWRRAVFPFRTYPTASVVDGKPCFAIDYDIPQNPPRVRPIYDEVRRVDSGLYLGRGMRRTSGPTPRLVLWFALDATIPDAGVTFADH